MDKNSDASLWRLFIEGDDYAFSSIFKLYYGQLFHYGLKISSNRAMIEDCIQNFFIYLHKSRASLSRAQNVKSYLFTSFRRMLLKKLKEERNFSSLDEEFVYNEMFEFSFQELDMEQELLKLKSELLAQILNTLPTRQREVIYLKYYCELPMTEISEVMEISYQSVLNTLQKAFHKLRNIAEDHEISRILKID